MKKSRFIKWWELTREKGKTRYILFNGVLLFGVPMLIFMSFVTNPFASGFLSEAALGSLGGSRQRSQFLLFWHHQDQLSYGQSSGGQYWGSLVGQGDT